LSKLSPETRLRIVKGFAAFNVTATIIWLAAWWLTSLHVWANHHLSLGGALFLSVAWMPLSVANLQLVSWSIRQDAKLTQAYAAELTAAIAAFRAVTEELAETYGVGSVDAPPERTIN
jgi:hypothetical protein